MEENQLRNKYGKLISQFSLWVKVDQAQLSEEMSKNSSRMFNVNCMKADAEYLKDKAEDAVKVMESNLDKKIRISAMKKKPSEVQIKQQLARNPQICEARERFFEAKWRFNICWAAASAIAQKGDQLKNLGHIRLKEMEHGGKARIINSEVSRLNKKGRE